MEHNADLSAALDAAPPADGRRFDPAAVVRTVNTLQPHGPLAIADTLRGHLAAGGGDPHSAARVLVVARLLFMTRDEPLPPLAHAFVLEGLPESNQTWPLLPLVLVFQVPFLLAPGPAEPPRQDPAELLEAYVTRGRLRDTLLEPETSPLHAAEVLVGSGDWRRVVHDDAEPRLRARVLGQALRAVGRHDQADAVADAAPEEAHWRFQEALADSEGAWAGAARSGGTGG